MIDNFYYPYVQTQQCKFCPVWWWILLGFCLFQLDMWATDLWTQGIASTETRDLFIFIVLGPKSFDLLLLRDSRGCGCFSSPWSSSLWDLAELEEIHLPADARHHSKHGLRQHQFMIQILHVWAQLSCYSYKAASQMLSGPVISSRIQWEEAISLLTSC